MAALLSRSLGCSPDNPAGVGSWCSVLAVFRCLVLVLVLVLVLLVGLVEVVRLLGLVPEERPVLRARGGRQPLGHWWRRRAPGAAWPTRLAAGRPAAGTAAVAALSGGRLSPHRVVPRRSSCRTARRDRHRRRTTTLPRYHGRRGHVVLVQQGDAGVGRVGRCPSTTTPWARCWARRAAAAAAAPAGWRGARGDGGAGAWCSRSPRWCTSRAVPDAL